MEKAKTDDKNKPLSREKAIKNPKITLSSQNSSVSVIFQVIIGIPRILYQGLGH